MIFHIFEAKYISIIKRKQFNLQVNLIETIGLTKAKLDMCVQEGGKNFSTGERQLLCLARTIVRQKRILVLDEATSNIDLRYEKVITYLRG